MACRDSDVFDLDEEVVGGETSLSGDFRDAPEVSGSDFVVQVVVGGEGSEVAVTTTWHVHRHILSIGALSAPYFRGMLSSNLRESQLGEVQLHLPRKQAEAFDLALEYMYQQTLHRWSPSEVSTTKVVGLFALANFLRIEKLQREVLERFRSTFTAETCLPYLVDCLHLRQAKWAEACCTLTARTFESQRVEALYELPAESFVDVLLHPELKASPQKKSKVVTAYIRSREVVGTDPSQGAVGPSWSLPPSACCQLLASLSTVRGADAVYLLGVSHRMGAAALEERGALGDIGGMLAPEENTPGVAMDPRKRPFDKRSFEEDCLAATAKEFSAADLEDLQQLPSDLVTRLCERDDLVAPEDFVFQAIQLYVNAYGDNLSSQEQDRLWRTVRYGFLSKVKALEAAFIPSVPKDAMAQDLALALAGEPILRPGDEEALKKYPRLNSAWPRKGYAAAGITFCDRITNGCLPGGEEVSITVSSLNACGLAVKGTMKCQKGRDDDEGNQVPVATRDNKDGTYTLSFVAPHVVTATAYDLSISIGGRPVEGSPFCMHVLSRWSQPCCVGTQVKGLSVYSTADNPNGHFLHTLPVVHHLPHRWAFRIDSFADNSSESTGLCSILGLTVLSGNENAGCGTGGGWGAFCNRGTLSGTGIQLGRYSGGSSHGKLRHNGQLLPRDVGLPSIVVGDILEITLGPDASGSPRVTFGIRGSPCEVSAPGGITADHLKAGIVAAFSAANSGDRVTMVPATPVSPSAPLSPVLSTCCEGTVCKVCPVASPPRSTSPRSSASSHDIDLSTAGGQGGPATWASQPQHPLPPDAPVPGTGHEWLTPREDAGRADGS